MIALRGHHFLCLLTYIGRGYSPAFVRSMDAVAAEIGAGDTVQIVTGADALCAPLQAEQHACAAHCHTDRTLQRDAAALRAVGHVLGQTLQAGDALTLSKTDIALLRAHFASEPDFRKACIGCEWHGLCDDVAAGGFQGVKL